MRCGAPAKLSPARTCQFALSGARHVPRASCPPPGPARARAQARASFGSSAGRGNDPGLSSYGSSEFLARRHRIKSENGRRLSPARARLARRSKISGIGIIACAVCIFAIVKSGAIPAPATGKKRHGSTAGTTLTDGPRSIAPAEPASSQNKVEQVATGTSTIPTFPKMMQLWSLEAASDASAAVAERGAQDYQLVGLGVRTVSFVGIQVYVVGLYIAVADIVKLQERLVRQMDAVATTLVPGERQRLRELLADPVRGEEIWDQILREGGLRTAFRIVPTRNTDLMHLRDGWMRGITSRVQARTAAGDRSLDDDAFGAGVNAFKSVWGSGARKSVAKGGTLLLTRDAAGKLAVWSDNDAATAATSGPGPGLRLGEVADERISRLIWLGYLAGRNVSSEAARGSIVDGVMDFLERPVGTVAQQVV